MAVRVLTILRQERVDQIQVTLHVLLQGPVIGKRSDISGQQVGGWGRVCASLDMYAYREGSRR